VDPRERRMAKEILPYWYSIDQESSRDLSHMRLKKKAAPLAMSRCLAAGLSVSPAIPGSRVMRLERRPGHRYGEGVDRAATGFNLMPSPPLASVSNADSVDSCYDEATGLVIGMTVAAARDASTGVSWMLPLDVISRY